MLRKAFLLSLLMGAGSLTGVGSALAAENDVVENDDTSKKTNTVSVADADGYDSDEEVAELQKKLEAAKAKKAEKIRKEKKAAKKAELQTQLAALEAELSDEEEAAEASETAPMPATTKASENESGLPDDLHTFINAHFGGPNNPRGDVLLGIQWALRYKSVDPASVQMTHEQVVDGQTHVLTFPVPGLQYKSAQFDEVKLYASEVTRPDERNSNTTHIEWKFQYNPNGSGNTLHPTHCYYTPGGQKPRVPNPNSNSFQIGQLFNSSNGSQAGGALKGLFGR